MPLAVKIPVTMPDLTHRVKQEIVSPELDERIFHKYVYDINPEDELLFEPISLDIPGYVKIRTGKPTNQYATVFNKKYQQIHAKFVRELSNYQDYIATDINEAIETFEKISKKIASLDFDQIAVEITPSNAIKFIIKLDDQLLISIIKPFGMVEDLGNEDVIFNFHKDRELLISDISNIDALVKGIKDFVDM